MKKEEMKQEVEMKEHDGMFQEVEMKQQDELKLEDPIENDKTIQEKIDQGHIEPGHMAKFLSECLDDDCYFPQKFRPKGHKSPINRKRMRKAVLCLKNRLKRLGVTLLVVMLFLASPAIAIASSELEALKKPVITKEKSTASARDLAMREAAMGASVQAGARWRYLKILEEVVIPKEKELDELFDFEHLVSRYENLIVVPPVVTRASKALRIDNESTLENNKFGSAVSQGQSYQMVRPAHLATLVPHWRHYLMNLPDGPLSIDNSLLPIGELESRRWRDWVDRGWSMGVEHADKIFSQNANNLARDYAGMMLFKRLVLENLASGPVTFEKIIGTKVTDDSMVFDIKSFELVEPGRFVGPK
ncbi:MAG: type IV secretion system DotC family protein [Deltaproteobacteria bacterium]|nr:type IV secretion system DotC family protein [Deltaproteobacteria bacterium]